MSAQTLLSEQRKSDALARADDPRCEAERQCADGCCPPERCANTARWRVSIGCEQEGCPNAHAVLVLCDACAHDVAQLFRVVGRRPL